MLCIPIDVLRFRPDAPDGEVEKEVENVFRGEVPAAGEVGT
jgi:hypothetical protein